MKAKSSPRFWFSLIIFGWMGQVAWVVENMYFNVFLYKMFHADAAHISLLVAASAVCAALTALLMGALSDRIGRRKPLIWMGYVLWGISIFSFSFLTPDTLSALFPHLASTALLGIQLTVVMDCVMTFFGSTANDAAFNAWLTDAANPSRRGAAEGVNAMMPMIAMLSVFGGFMYLDLEKAENWKFLFILIGSVTALIGFCGIFLLEEPQIPKQEGGYWNSVVYSFLPSTVKKNASLYLLLAIFVLFNVAIQIFMPYLILYYEVSLKLSNYVLILAPATILASLAAAFWGKVYDKKGFSFSGLVSVLVLASGCLILFLTRATPWVFLGSLLMMSGYLSAMAVFGAAIRARIPEGKAGRFQGVRIFAQVLIPGVVGPFLGSMILKHAETVQNSDGTLSFLPNANIFLGAFLTLLPVVPMICFLGAYFRKKEFRPQTLTTPFEEDLRPEALPYREYPRPQMVRDSYFSLNGFWSFALEKNKTVEELGKILVPFPPQSRLSGIEREIHSNETMIYQRSFSLPEGFIKDRVLLHFGAVDQTARVEINGRSVGESTLPYLPFSFDVTDALIPGENTLRVTVKDTQTTDLPWGKQRKNRGGMWYTPISGIWQSVWMESVAENAVEALRIEAESDRVRICVSGGEEEKTLILWGNGRAEEYRFLGKEITLSFAQPHLWTPEDPFLYRFTLISGSDRIESYFALREIGICEKDGVSLLTLNGKPYYFHGLLDQGYYPDGIFLPATPRGFEEDILKMKSCGFNTLRKHIKIEPDLFYYDCDRLGMIVFQDFINTGKYSFLRDTALPTIGIRRGISRASAKKAEKAFLLCAEKTQDVLFNHPSVVYYTVFNEGWGQFDADRCYARLKKRDPSRIYDATSGWFQEKDSDVESDHVYFRPVPPRKNFSRPAVLSEFGGYSLPVDGHRFNPKNNYGYRSFSDAKEFESALLSLYQEQILPRIEEGLSATVLTQVSDVEDETNGLVTYDRKVLKVDEKRMQEMAAKLSRAFSRRFGS